MGAAFVAARYKSGVGKADFFQRIGNVIAFDSGWICGWANQHKVVVHDRIALERKAIGHKFFFGCLVMHKQHIGVTPPAHVDSLAGANRHDLHVDV